MTDEGRLDTRSLMVVVLAASAFVAVRAVLRLPLSLPGHNVGLFTLFLVLAAGTVRRPPAGAAYGALAGLLALVVGIGAADGPAVVARYALPGLLVDVALVAGARLDRRGWGLALGATAGLLKLAVSLGWAAVVGQPVEWIATQALVAIPVHLASGALGGWVGATLVERLRRVGRA